MNHLPGIWNNTTKKLFAVGIGRKDSFEVTIMESLGPLFVEDVEHSVDDTWNLDSRTSMMSVFELLATLQNEYDNQRTS
ncbi:hypothetical protein RO3G_12717 [Rhizopus delemar RA 99-880]|uniref:Uncharacterized protein n=1 Tax=Rhizopus delemar (strain RA 99-880 / ATCC MYA-4621 / FGSC 9543 / NRRL 43880) TaxID=246409 RepID=I1CHS6_RHIO9|nr:hypothetical protein RO3G_12717 [Rhizopus delemar RA 99-880]|eukprot:EIE88006.1 hypothetical protein RO3G_12717 [Rhizopus delemar RA 99-880]